MILHGTDTLAYTSSALSFMLETLGKPVRVTMKMIVMIVMMIMIVMMNLSASSAILSTWVSSAHSALNTEVGQ